MQNKYGGKGVALLALSAESNSKVKPFVKANKINYVVASDANAAKRKYGIRGWPTYFVVDPKGTVAYVGHSSKKAELSVEKLLKENPPTSKGPLESMAAKSVYRKARKYHKQKDYAKALRAYKKVVRDYKDTPYGKKAAARIKKIKADPQIVAIIRESEMKRRCDNWLDTAQTLVTMGKNQEAAEYYQRIIDKYPNSKYAKIAQKAMANL